MYKTFFFASSILIAGFSNNINAQEPINLQIKKKQLISYHDQGEYDLDLKKVVSQARKYLALRITENSKKIKKQKLAIVFDIDETTITNYDYMRKNSFGGSLNDFNQNILKHKLPVIKPMRTFYNFAKQNKVAIFFVTGRKRNVRTTTAINLKKAGYTGWQKIYFKPQNYNQTSVIPFKSGARKQITAQGYTIVESIGDQNSDLKGGYTEKTFKLPNPYYYIP